MFYFTLGISVVKVSFRHIGVPRRAARIGGTSKFRARCGGDRIKHEGAVEGGHGGGAVRLAGGTRWLTQDHMPKFSMGVSVNWMIGCVTIFDLGLTCTFE